MHASFDRSLASKNSNKHAFLFNIRFDDKHFSHKVGGNRNLLDFTVLFKNTSTSRWFSCWLCPKRPSNRLFSHRLGHACARISCAFYFVSCLVQNATQIVNIRTERQCHTVSLFCACIALCKCDERCDFFLISRW